MPAYEQHVILLRLSACMVALMSACACVCMHGSLCMHMRAGACRMCVFVWGMRTRHGLGCLCVCIPVGALGLSSPLPRVTYAPDCQQVAPEHRVLGSGEGGQRCSSSPLLPENHCSEDRENPPHCSGLSGFIPEALPTLSSTLSLRRSRGTSSNPG